MKKEYFDRKSWYVKVNCSFNNGNPSKPPKVQDYDPSELLNSPSYLMRLSILLILYITQCFLGLWNFLILDKFFQDLRYEFSKKTDECLTLVVDHDVICVELHLSFNYCKS